MSHREQNKFCAAIPGVSAEEFNSSAYLYYYNQADPRPSRDDVIQSLLNLTTKRNHFHSVCKMIEREHPDYDVLKVFTSQVQCGTELFYEYINKTIFYDARHKLEYLMPFIRRATTQINFRPPGSRCVVYRGMDLDSEQEAYFTPGTVFRFPGFTSTSERRSIAEHFGNTLFKIYIPANCPQVRDVAEFSDFPTEQEYLFVPYSLFQVIQRNRDVIKLRSIDNMAYMRKRQIYTPKPPIFNREMLTPSRAPFITNAQFNHPVLRYKSAGVTANYFHNSSPWKFQYENGYSNAYEKYVPNGGFKKFGFKVCFN